MKSFILALLPGLEEETGEYFDKVRLFRNSTYAKDINYAAGPCFTGSPCGHNIPVVLLPEHLAGHANYPPCAGNSAQLPVQATTPLQA